MAYLVFAFALAICGLNGAIWFGVGWLIWHEVLPSAVLGLLAFIVALFFLAIIGSNAND